jgi:hypothetical protein
MEKLNYTKNGKYKVMLCFTNGPTVIYNRFDTLEEAEYVIGTHSNFSGMVDYFVNSDSEFWLEIEE